MRGVLGGTYRVAGLASRWRLWTLRRCIVEWFSGRELPLRWDSFQAAVFVTVLEITGEPELLKETPEVL